MSSQYGDRFGFRHIAERELHLYKLELDAASQDRLLMLIENGTSTLVRGLSRTEESRRRENMIREATVNLRMLISKLGERARESETRTVNNRMFSDVMAGICPLWPFC